MGERAKARETNSNRAQRAHNSNGDALYPSAVDSSDNDNDNAGGADQPLPRPKHCVVCKDKREYAQLACLLGCAPICCNSIEIGALDGAVFLDEEVCLCPKVGNVCGQETRTGRRVRESQLKTALKRRWKWLAALAAVVLPIALWLRLLPLDDSPRKALVPVQTDHLDVVAEDSTAAAATAYSIPLTPGALPPFRPSVEIHSDAEIERAMDIYCRGPILHAVQMAGVFADSKHFVDMPIKANSSAFDIIVDFERRQLAVTEFRPSARRLSHATQLRTFLDDHFDPPGTELSPITPFDYQELETPPMIASIEDETLRDWAFSLHQLWRTLGRVPSPHVRSSYLHAKALDNPVLQRPQNILIVPGGRFRESYYWDSYWIVQGLLVSNMNHTARGVVNNLLEYVAEFGFVPNGGRIYYLTRSQPPMLSDMVKLVAQTSRDASAFDIAYLNATVPILEKEYAFWMQLGPSGHAVEVVRPARDGSNMSVTHILNRYTSSANHPRPESYREDVDVAAEIYGSAAHTRESNTLESDAKKDMYYNDIIAAAESGWDFSSRWFRDNQDMKTVATSSIVPVDLNAIMHRMETNLATFHAHLGDSERVQFFRDAARRRIVAMSEVLWNATLGTWKDYNLETAKHAAIAAVSDYTPLWANAFNASDTALLARAVRSLQDSGLLQVGGIQTTNVHSGQQWDAPNAWPPEQDIVVEGLLAVNTHEATALARELAQSWVHSSLAAWKHTGLMFEKYNATEVGGLGVGGEYFPQFGFGWTNGVILKFVTMHQHLLRD